MEKLFENERRAHAEKLKELKQRHATQLDSIKALEQQIERERREHIDKELDIIGLTVLNDGGSIWTFLMRTVISVIMAFTAMWCFGRCMAWNQNRRQRYARQRQE